MSEQRDVLGNEVHDKFVCFINGYLVTEASSVRASLKSGGVVSATIESPTMPVQSDVFEGEFEVRILGCRGGHELLATCRMDELLIDSDAIGSTVTIRFSGTRK